MKRISAGRRLAYRSRHKKKGIGWNGKFFIVVLICAFALFVTAILLGNYLGKLSRGGPETTAAAKTSREDPASGIPIPRDNIIARHLDFDRIPDFSAGSPPESSAPSNTDGTSAEESTAGDTYADGTEPGRTGTGGPGSSGELPFSYDSVSLVLRYLPERESGGEQTSEETSGPAGPVKTGTGMKLAYTSPVALTHGYDETSDESLGGNLALLAKRRDVLCVSGIFDVTFHTSSYSMREIMREYELALLEELWRFGLSDFVLRGFGAGDISDAEEFAAELLGRTKNGCRVFIALGFDFFESDGARETVKEFADRGVFFALDLSDLDIPGLMSAQTLVYDRVSRLSSLLLTYGMRVVVGCGSPEGYDGEVAGAVRGGARNIQVRGRPSEARKEAAAG